MAQYHHTAPDGVAILLCESCEDQFPEDALDDQGRCPPCSDPFHYLEVAEYLDSLERARRWF